MSWRPMVLVGREWAGSGLRFATEQEALAYARDLSLRWTLVLDYRAEQSADPVTCEWDGGVVYLQEVAT